MPTTRIVVMISSTARNLPEHRKQVMDACHRCSCDFAWMETLPASDSDAVTESMKLVDRADVYIGIFAHRYGYVPAGSDISITEMEYERAGQRGIPRLIFFIHDDHPITKAMVEMGPAAEKLEKFKQRIGTKHVAAFFKNADDLRGHVLHALPVAIEQLQTPEDAAAIPSLHFVHPIPKPPEPYIAHYYALLQTGKIIGRRAELDRLTQWITKSQNPMMHVIAIGGMGKSALTWYWFHHIAPQEWPRMRGRIWWSFYESDGHFDNFVTRSLAYVSGQSEAELRKQNLRDRMDALLWILQSEPYLVVLDGLERILTAYARMDAPYLKDDDLDEKTQNAILDAQGYPQGFYQAAVGRHTLRLAADPNVGRFLKILCQLRESRILTSSRLFPADLQLPNGQTIAGVESHFLEGLNETDAIDLWRAYGCKGTSERMLPIFRSFGLHPLVLKVFAGKVAHYRLAPGDFDAWQKANPAFKPFGELVQVQSHILEHALRDLSLGEEYTMRILSGFRMPVGYGTLDALLVKRRYRTERLQQTFSSIEKLDAILTRLEDRGLLGWNRKANRYDLHPIVRGVAWDLLLNGKKRQALCEMLRRHFNAMPPEDWRKVESLEDLSNAIELYDKLITLGRHNEAFDVFRHRLDQATLDRLSAAQVRLELLERLFADGIDQLPHLQLPYAQSHALNALGQAFQYAGLPGKAAEVFARKIKLDIERRDSRDLAIGLCSASCARRLIGELHRAETVARQALLVSRNQKDGPQEVIGLQWLATATGICGRCVITRLAFRRATAMLRKTTFQSRVAVEALAAQADLWIRRFQEAQKRADTARVLTQGERIADVIQCLRLQGEAALHLADFSLARARLAEVLKRVHSCDVVEEELPTLIALAELDRQQHDPAKAREYLDEVWDKCERGPYPLFHADAYNVLAQIERDTDHKMEAIAAATKAYQQAWCDGPPFAYHWGLEAAKKHLRELGAPFPNMPPFDESKYPPMPEVEINPRGEYYVEPEA